METLSANIFAIKRYALHDGPNIRTTIFFKGCPLFCHWCHNPEGIDFISRVITNFEKCVGCGECLERCPQGALHQSDTGIRRDTAKCTSCAICEGVCPALAHEATGKMMSIPDIMAEIKKELPFFDQSGGGITCSGGEPLSQPKSLVSLLTACGQLGIHRAVDTSGFARADTLLAIARHAELFLFDLKHMDSAIHENYTGVGNALILSNLKALGSNGHTIRVRIPLIGGVNDDEKNIEATGAFVARCKGVQGIDILPYHPSATAKYRKLGQTYKGTMFTAPAKADIAGIADILKKYVTEVTIGG
jgi:pyruvate formate lyase activating enzyme